MKKKEKAQEKILQTKQHTRKLRLEKQLEEKKNDIVAEAIKRE